MEHNAAQWLPQEPGPARQVRHGLFALIFTAVTGMAAYCFLCGWSFSDAWYMLIITISTVGYGEVGPSTPWVRLVNSYVILLGITAGAYTFGGLIQLMAEGQFRRLMTRQIQERKIENLNNHHIVCGFGRMGEMICQELQHREQPFVLVELNPQRVEEADNLGILNVMGDATDEDVLEHAGISRAKSLVCVLPADTDNVYVTLTARNMNPNLFITARAEKQTAERKLHQAGANCVVSPYVIGAQRITNLLTRPTTVEILELVSGRASVDLEMNEIAIPENSSIVGKTLAEADIRGKTGVIVVAIKRTDGKLHVTPDSESEVHTGDTVVILGRRENIDRFRQTFSVSE